MPVNAQNFTSSFLTIESCLVAVQSWMWSNMLKLNPDKTEFILLGSKQHLSKLSRFCPVSILGSRLNPSNKVKNLGVVFDSHMSLSNHISSVCRSCYYHIRDLNRMRKAISKNVATMLANALVSSRVDYCNSLFYSLTSNEINRLQRVQNTLARIILKLPYRSTTNEARRSLHWLPIRSRSVFKILNIAYKALQTGQPQYIKSLLDYYTCTRDTRRSQPQLKYLQLPPHSKNCTSIRHLDLSFHYAAPKLWNSLPVEIRTAPSLSSFRSRLKSYLFSKAFPP